MFKSAIPYVCRRFAAQASGGFSCHDGECIGLEVNLVNIDAIFKAPSENELLFWIWCIVHVLFAKAAWRPERSRQETDRKLTLKAGT